MAVRASSSGLTGRRQGFIVGIADFSRNSLHLAHAFPQPEDSLGSPARFERGVVGLVQSIDDVARRSMHQVRYLGEWHSHPRYANARPGNTDIAQLAYLGSELAADGLPGLMAIAAHQGDGYCMYEARAVTFI